VENQNKRVKVSISNFYITERSKPTNLFK